MAKLSGCLGQERALGLLVPHGKLALAGAQFAKIGLATCGVLLAFRKKANDLELPCPNYKSCSQVSFLPKLFAENPVHVFGASHKAHNVLALQKRRDSIPFGEEVEVGSNVVVAGRSPKPVQKMGVLFHLVLYGIGL